MQRKGVPAIDGCLCEIKEKLKALYDRTHACILRINGKTPDGNGDITLDLSDAIPGRYVESVNGQDGNVIIDKASVGLSNVDNVSSSQILNQADANNQSRLEAFEAAKLDPIELEVTANSGRIIQLEGQQVVLDDKMEQTIQYVDAIGDDVAAIPTTYATKSALQGVSTDLGTTQTQLTNLANELHINKPYVTTNTDQTIDATKIFTKVTYGVTPGDGDNANAFVTKENVMSTNGKLNNLVHTISNESIGGEKNFLNRPYLSWDVALGSTFYHEYLRMSAKDTAKPIVTIVGAQDLSGSNKSTNVQFDVYQDGNMANHSRLFLTHEENRTLLQIRRYKNGAIVSTYTIASINDP